MNAKYLHILVIKIDFFELLFAMLSLPLHRLLTSDFCRFFKLTYMTFIKICGGKFYFFAGSAWFFITRECWNVFAMSIAVSFPHLTSNVRGGEEEERKVKWRVKADVNLWSKTKRNIISLWCENGVGGGFYMIYHSKIFTSVWVCVYAKKEDVFCVACHKEISQKAFLETPLVIAKKKRKIPDQYFHYFGKFCSIANEWTARGPKNVKPSFFSLWNKIPGNSYMTILLQVLVFYSWIK